LPQVFISEFSESSFLSEIWEISEGRIRNKEQVFISEFSEIRNKEQVFISEFSEIRNKEYDLKFVIIFWRMGF